MKKKKKKNIYIVSLCEFVFVESADPTNQVFGKRPEFLDLKNAAVIACIFNLKTKTKAPRWGNGRGIKRNKGKMVLKQQVRGCRGGRHGMRTFICGKNCPMAQNYQKKI